MPQLKEPKARRSYTQDVEILSGRPHTGLKSQWRAAFGMAPPKNMSKRLVIHALAYELQAKAYGGLPKATRKRLASLVESAVKPSRTMPLKLSPGTRLMREWRGMVHVVDVTVEGFLWNGRHFRSLSAIARAITGAHWNGLAFFGLRKRREPRRSDGDTAPAKDAA